MLAENMVGTRTTRRKEATACSLAENRLWIYLRAYRIQLVFFKPLNHNENSAQPNRGQSGLGPNLIVALGSLPGETDSQLHALALPNSTRPMPFYILQAYKLHI